MSSNCENKTCYIKASFAIGLTWALGVFVMGILAWLCGYGLAMVGLFSSIYIGYAPTFLGSIIGAVWAFFDAFFFVLIAMLIYCCLSKCCKS
jgi:hypothetical protein